MERLDYEPQGHVRLIALRRPEKRNAFDLKMLRELAEAYTEAENDVEARCLVLGARGDHFTAGLDLAEVGPAVASGQALFPETLVDPLGLYGRKRTKPVVMAARGFCLTIGIELALASDIVIAAKSTKFGQIEIKRGIFPFGGATLRLPRASGWQNAMRWLLTGDTFDAAEAHRIGLVQEVTEDGADLEKALAIAETISKQAPLAVSATLLSARTAVEEGHEAAAKGLVDHARRLMKTEDAAEGLRSFVERREAKFSGK
jgi:enoyl-CoA hydratase